MTKHIAKVHETHTERVREPGSKSVF
jgi:hypothetical protein